MAWWHGAGLRLRALFRRREEEEEMEEEMRFHLEMEAEKLLGQGLSPEEARRQARVRFGGVERMKSRARDEWRVGGWDDLRRNVAYAFRGFRRNPGFTFTAVVTLAVGIGATVASFSLVDGVLLRPLPFHEANRLVEIRELAENGRRFFPSFPNFQDWRERSRSFDGVVAIQPMGVVPVMTGEEPRRVGAMGVSSGFLATLGVPAFRGRDFAPDETVPGGPPVALVSHGLWRDGMGSGELDGARIQVSGRDYQVVGVLPPGFRLFNEADVVLANEQFPGTIRSAHAYRVVARVRDGLSLEAAHRELDQVTAVMAEEYAGQTQAASTWMAPLPDQLLGDHRRPLFLLFLAAGLVLLVAATNVASTLLARGTVRVRELSIRSSLGASRRRLVSQLLVEAGILSGAGAGLGALLATGAIRAAARVAPDVLPRFHQVGMDGRVLAFAAAVALGSTFLFGLLPALGLTGRRMADSVRGTRTATTSDRRRWNLLLSFESALAVVLLVGAGLLLRSVDRILGMEAGWDPTGVLQVELTNPGGVFEDWEGAVAHYRVVLDELGALPGVSAVGITNRTPLQGGDYTAPARDPSREDNPENYSGWRTVNPDFFHALGMRVLQGRLPEEGESEVAVVNQALAELLWPGEDPMGKSVTSNFDYDDRTFRVVGVVANARDWRIAEERQTELFVPWTDAPQHLIHLSLLLRTDGDPATLVAPVRRRLLELEGRIPASFQTLESSLEATAADRRFVAGVLVLFALSGLVLALVGIVGVIGYTVARRRKEIAVRMALGARASRIRKEVHGQVQAAVVPGVAVGLLAALGLSGFLESLLYEVSALDPRVYLGVGGLFLVAALAAADLPARRGARANPSALLREE